MKIMGKIIGLIIVGGAVIAVFFFDFKDEEPELPPLVRPLKTFLVEAPNAYPEQKYPGKVRANREVNLAFEVSGTMIEKLVKKGDQVEQGKLLARLDPRDYQNDLAKAKAEGDRAQAHLERIKKAAESNAVSKQEVSDAQAAYDVAQAQIKIAAKALDDTNMRARFAGVIANTFAEEFENIQARQPIMSLQDVTSVDVEINVPEERIARINPAVGAERHAFVAIFDYLPGREFEVKLKEFSTEADPLTQTYTASFVMDSPKDLTILPGMTATIVEYQVIGEYGENIFAVPINAVPVDGVGQYYVWLVKQKDQRIYTVHRVNVEVGRMAGDQIMVTKGLSDGDRVAAAGVGFLREGQEVSLLTKTGAPES